MDVPTAAVGKGAGCLSFPSPGTSCSSWVGWICFRSVLRTWQGLKAYHFVWRPLKKLLWLKGECERKEEKASNMAKDIRLFTTCPD